MEAKTKLSRLQTVANEELPNNLAGLEEPKKVGITVVNAVYVEIDVQTPNQESEDAIEEMKLQFAEISEKKAKLENDLEPLKAEDERLKSEIINFEDRRQERSVSVSCGLLCH